MDTQKRERPTPEEAGQLAAVNSKCKVTKDNYKERMKASQDQITLDYCEDDVIIFSEFTEDDHEICNCFYFGIAPDKGSIVTINLSRDQAKVVKDLLADYLEAFEVHRRLSKEYPVKARRGA